MKRASELRKLLEDYYGRSQAAVKRSAFLPPSGKGYDRLQEQFNSPLPPLSPIPLSDGASQGSNPFVAWAELAESGWTPPLPSLHRPEQLGWREFQELRELAKTRTVNFTPRKLAKMYETDKDTVLKVLNMTEDELKEVKRREDAEAAASEAIVGSLEVQDGPSVRGKTTAELDTRELELMQKMDELSSRLAAMQESDALRAREAANVASWVPDWMNDSVDDAEVVGEEDDLDDHEDGLTKGPAWQLRREIKKLAKEDVADESLPDDLRAAVEQALEDELTNPAELGERDDVETELAAVMDGLIEIALERETLRTVDAVPPQLLFRAGQSGKPLKRPTLEPGLRLALTGRVDTSGLTTDN